MGRMLGHSTGFAGFLLYFYVNQSRHKGFLSLAQRVQRGEAQLARKLGNLIFSFDSTGIISSKSMKIKEMVAMFPVV